MGMDDADIESTMPGRLEEAYFQIIENNETRPKIMKFSVELCHGDPARGIPPHYVMGG